MSERCGRRTDAEILSELDECDNAVTRSVLKDVCVSRLRDAEQREAKLVEVLCEARSLIDSFGYSLASRVPMKCAAGVRKRMNETLAKIDRLVAEQ